MNKVIGAAILLSSLPVGYLLGDVFGFVGVIPAFAYGVWAGITGTKIILNSA